MTAARWPGKEGGSTSLELAVLTPVLLLLLSLAVMAGRVQLARGAVDQAADDAARVASLARAPTAAQTGAFGAARTVLAQQSLQCSSLTVSVDTDGFAVPVGEPANVSATVVCVVALTDLAPGLPGHVTETFTMVSPLDSYRGRAADTTGGPGGGAGVGGGA